MDARIDGLHGEIATTRTWGLALFVSFAGAMLGVMARGFGWI